MSYDSFSEQIINSIHGTVLELFHDIDEDMEYDRENFEYVDGEEGDYGIVRYLHKNECVMVEFNLAGDWIEYQYTKYAVDNIIQPKFNFKLDIPYLEDSSQENCVAHLMVKRFDKLKSQIGTLESVLTSSWLDEDQKKEIEELFRFHESFVDKVKP